MTSVNLMPGIQRFSIEQNKQNEKQVKISFTVTGMNRLYDHWYPKKPFYLYVFLTYQNGGKETVVLSSSFIHFDETMLNKSTLNFTTTLEITNTDNERNENFLDNYYSAEIIYSDFEAQDGSDINYIFNHGERIISTKLNFEGEKHEG